MGKNGGARPGAGRKLHGHNKIHKEAAKAVVLTGKTPAEYLDEVMNTAEDEGRRVDAAKALLPYVHKKQPEAHEVEHQGLPDTITFVFE